MYYIYGGWFIICLIWLLYTFHLIYFLMILKSLLYLYIHALSTYREFERIGHETVKSDLNKPIIALLYSRSITKTLILIKEFGDWL